MGWELAQGKDCLWVSALQAKYCQGAHFFNVPMRLGASWIWHSLLQTSDLVRAGFGWNVRDGSLLNIQCAPWVPDLLDYTPRLKLNTLVDRRLNYVRDLIHNGTNTWQEDLIRFLFTEESADAIMHIKLPPCRLPDFPRQTLSSKGVYSVKEAYLHDQKDKLRDMGALTSQEWTKQKLKIQHCLKLFLWKVAATALQCDVMSQMRALLYDP